MPSLSQGVGSLEAYGVGAASVPDTIPDSERHKLKIDTLPILVIPTGYWETVIRISQF